MNRTYTVFGSSIHKQTSEIVSTIEQSFKSYCLARIFLIEMKKYYPDMTFVIDLNKDMNLTKLSNFEQNSAHLN